MKKILRQIWEDIKRGKNIDLMSTVALTFIITVLNALNISSPNLVSSATLATLCLLAIGLLATRNKLELILHKQDSKNIVQFFTGPLSSLEETFRDGKTKEIWMLGLALRGTIKDYFYNFGTDVSAIRDYGQVSKSAKVRAIISDWKKIDIDITVRRLARKVKPDDFRTEYEETISQLREFRRSAKNPEEVHLRLLDFVPPISLYIFPKTKGRGVVYVEVYCYKSRDGSIPKFCITEQDNPDWYKHFVRQFELMWQDAKEFAL